MDPMSYNLYAYCKNNPVAYVDPSGNWSACVHRNDTFWWAYYSGFSEEQAIIIALGCSSVDNDPNTRTEYPLESNLSYHFNRQNKTTGKERKVRILV